MSLSNGNIEALKVNGSGGYSAVVRLRLRIAGVELQLGQVGHDRIIMDENSVPVEPIDERTGEVVMTIDGVEDRWPVRLATTLREGRLVGNSRIVSLIT